MKNETEERFGFLCGGRRDALTKQLKTCQSRYRGGVWIDYVLVDSDILLVRTHYGNAQKGRNDGSRKLSNALRKVYPGHFEPAIPYIGSKSWYESPQLRKYRYTKNETPRTAIGIGVAPGVYVPLASEDRLFDGLLVPVE